MAVRLQIMARRKRGRPLKLEAEPQPALAASAPELAQAAIAAAAAVARLQATMPLAGAWVGIPLGAGAAMRLLQPHEMHVCLHGHWRCSNSSKCQETPKANALLSRTSSCKIC